MILINGCSFTAGDENWPIGFETEGYSLFDNKKSAEPFDVYNAACGGSGNDIMRRKVFRFLNSPHYNNPIRPHSTVDYAIVQWSTIDRWDYPVFVDNIKAKNFPRMDMHPERIGKINYMLNGTDTFGYGKEFFEKYYSIHGAVLQTLESIYHTQQYFKEKNIPYKMITIGNLFQMDVTLEKLYNLQKEVDSKRGNYATLKTESLFDKLEPFENSWFEADIIPELLEKIDFDKFIFTDDVRINGFGGGILEYFANKGQTMLGGHFHPSKEQSIDFFTNFLWSKIKDDVEKYHTKINK
jgi:hypothetical protein